MNKSIIGLIVLIFGLNIGLVCLKKTQSQPVIKQQPVISGVAPTPLIGDSSHFKQNQPEGNQSKDLFINFVSVDVYRQAEKGSIYGDILSHSKSAPFGDASGRSTNAHETTHGINSEIRNQYMANFKRRVNGFYVLEGRGVVIEEPAIKMSHIIPFIPANLRSYRYDLYMVKQLRDWDDTPLYVCDEWIAYINGGKCCVDDVKKKQHKENWTDGVSGCLDFSIYTVALAMAVKQYDPEYWRSNDQFRNFIAWQLNEAENTFLEGRGMPEFKWDKQDELLRQLLTNPASEPVRKFLREEFRGLWLDIDPVSLTKR